MLGSSKQRITWAMASTWRIWLKNLLPKPSPLEAPATKPAMSTNRMAAGKMRLEPNISANTANRASGTSTTPTFGSIVQNG